MAEGGWACKGTQKNNPGFGPPVTNLVVIEDERDANQRMAVLALGKTNDPWAIDFLVRSSWFEKTPRVQHTILSVLSEQGYIELGPSKNAN